MKRGVVRTLLTLATLLTVSATVRAQESTHQLSEEGQKLEEKLVDRFNKMLAERLDNKDVSLSFSAGRHLDFLVRRGARMVVQDKKMEDLPKADDNWRFFADTLIKAAKEQRNEDRITSDTIESVLRIGVNWTPVPIRSLCPLFPICK